MSAKAITFGFPTHLEKAGKLLKICLQKDHKLAVHVEGFILKFIQETTHVRYIPKKEDLVPGLICIGQYDDQQYYRIKILDQTIQNQSVNVLFIDYGNFASLALTDIRLLSYEYNNLLNVPPLAIMCFLEGVDVHKQWNDEELSTLKKFILYEERQCVFRQLPNDITVVNIYILNTDKYLSDMIIENDLGTPLTDNDLLVIAKGMMPSLPYTERGDQNRLRLLQQKANEKQQSYNQPLPQFEQLNYHTDKVQMPESNLSMQILNVGTTHHVYISHMEEGPYSFFLQTKSNAEDALPRLTNLLKHQKPIPHTPPLMPGCMVMTLVRSDSSYRRSVLMNIRHDSCLVYHMDLGNTEEIPFSEIYQLPPQARHAPAMALRFRLADLKSQLVSEPAKAYFQELLERKCVLIRVVQEEQGNPLYQYCEMFYDNKNVKEILWAFNAPLEYTSHQHPRGKDVKVTVSVVESPSQFYVQYTSKLDVINNIQEAVNAYCASQVRLQDLSSINIGSPIAAFFEDNIWYRAMVVGINRDSAKVLYVDYGNRSDVPANHLCQISHELVTKWRTQAVECCLIGFENCGEVSDALKEKMSNKTLGLTYHLRLMSILNGSRLLVDLVDNLGGKVSEFITYTPTHTIPPYRDTPPYIHAAKDQSPMISSSFDAISINSGEQKGKFKNDSTAYGGRSNQRQTSFHSTEPSYIEHDNRDIDQNKNRGYNRQKSFDKDSRFTKSSDFPKKSPDSFDELNRGRFNERGGRGSVGSRGSDEMSDEKPKRGFGGPRSRQDDDKPPEFSDDRSRKGGFNRHRDNNRGADLGNDDRPRRQFNTGSRNDDDKASDQFMDDKSRKGFRGPRQEEDRAYGGRDKFNKSNQWDAGDERRGGRRAGEDNERRPVRGSGGDYNERRFAIRAGDDDKDKRFSRGEDDKDRRFNRGGNNDSSERRGGRGGDNGGSKWGGGNKWGGGDGEVTSDNRPRRFDNRRGDWKREDGGDDKRGGGDRRFNGGGGPRHSNWNKEESGGGNGDRKKRFENDNGSYKRFPAKDSFSDMASVESEAWNEETTKPAVPPVSKAFTEYPVLNIAANSEMKVHLAYMGNPFIFYVQTDGSEVDLDTIRATIDAETEASLVAMKDASIPVGTPVLARFSQDQLLYRGLVQQFYPPSLAQVLFIDFGNNDMVETKDMYLITHKLAQKAPIAIRCWLCDVSPIGGEWLEDAGLYSVHFEHSEALTMNVVSAKILDGEMVLYVKLTTPTGELISKLLERNGLAVCNDKSDSTPTEEKATPTLVADTVAISHEEPASSLHIPNKILQSLPNKWVDRFDLLVGQRLYCTVLETIEENLFVVSITEAKAVALATVSAEHQNISTIAPGTRLIIDVKAAQEDKLKVSFFDLGGSLLSPKDGTTPRSVNPICPCPVVRRLDHVTVPYSEGAIIYIQKHADASRLAELLDDMYNFYENTEPDLSIQWNIGDYCAALSAVDSNWYRARIISNPKENTVRFIDYGNTEQISPENLRKLDSKYIFSELCLSVLMSVYWKSPNPPFIEVVGDEVVIAKFTRDFNGKWIVDLTFSNGEKVSKKLSDMDITSDKPDSPFDDQNIIIGSNLTAGDSVQIVVSHEDSVTTFWAQMTKHTNMIDQLQDKLINMIDNLNDGKADELKVFAAKYSKDDLWYRGTKVDKNLMRFIDYGNTDVLSGEVKELPEDLMKPVSGYAIPMHLCVKPIGDGWSENAIEMHQAFIESPSLTAEIINVDYKIIVDLKAEEMLLSELLVNAGLAEYDDYTPKAIKKYLNVENPSSAVIVTEEVTEMSTNVPIPTSSVDNQHPEIGKDDRIFVVLPNSVNDFYIQEELKTDTVDEIQNRLLTVDLIKYTGKVENGQLFAVQFEEDDLWYRAKVISTQPKVQVLFIDYGNVVTTNDLRILPEDVVQHPPLAIRCSLDTKETPELLSSFLAIVNFGQTAFFIRFKSFGSPHIVSLLTDDRRDVLQILQSVNKVDQPFPEPAKLGVKPVVEQHLPKESPPPRTCQKEEIEHGPRITMELINPVLSDAKQGYISHINSTSDFYIQEISSMTMLDKINEAFSLMEGKHKVKTYFEKGDLVAAKYMDDGWYRALVTQREPEVFVQFVDYGNESIVTEVYDLPNRLKSFPYTPIKCCLSVDGNVLIENLEEKLHEICRGGETLFDFKVLSKNGNLHVIHLMVNGKSVLSLMEKSSENMLNNVSEAVNGEISTNATDHLEPLTSPLDKATPELTTNSELETAPTCNLEDDNAISTIPNEINDTTVSSDSAELTDINGISCEDSANTIMSDSKAEDQSNKTALDFQTNDIVESKDSEGSKINIAQVNSSESEACAIPEAEDVSDVVDISPKTNDETESSNACSMIGTKEENSSPEKKVAVNKPVKTLAEIKASAKPRIVTRLSKTPDRHTTTTGKCMKAATVTKVKSETQLDGEDKRHHPVENRRSHSLTIDERPVPGSLSQPPSPDLGGRPRLSKADKIVPGSISGNFLPDRDEQ